MQDVELREGDAPVFRREWLESGFVQAFAALRSEQGVRPLVVLNACQTGRLEQRLTSIGGFAEAFISAGAGAFVASLWSVGDEPAATFTNALYDGLLGGLPMAQAVRHARAVARDARDGTWLAYTVYAHPSAVLSRG
jgi:CHAT domain-containing protein